MKRNKKKSITKKKKHKKRHKQNLDPMLIQIQRKLFKMKKRDKQKKMLMKLLIMPKRQEVPELALVVLEVKVPVVAQVLADLETELVLVLEVPELEVVQPLEELVIVNGELVPSIQTTQLLLKQTHSKLFKKLPDNKDLENHNGLLKTKLLKKDMLARLRIRRMVSESQEEK